MNSRLRQNYKGEEIPIDSVQRNGGNHSITEQFPTLGNWLARMSKKQTSISKPKLQTSENTSFTAAENTTGVRIISFLLFILSCNFLIFFKISPIYSHNFIYIL